MQVAEKRLADYPWYVRLLLRLQRRKHGQVLKPALLWARSPLDGALRSLVMVLVSQRNGCRFCVDPNAQILAQRAGSMDKLYALPDWRTASGFSERERAALEYVEAMTAASEVPDSVFALLRRYFDEDGIVELTTLIAFQTLSSKFNSALGVPAQGFCELPEWKSGRQKEKADRVR